MVKTLYQQGDVLIKSPGMKKHGGEVFKGIPAGALSRKGNVLAEGEATGHAHRVIPCEGTDVELLELGDRLFMRILGGDARVVHEEHGEHVIPPGDYEIEKVREYDHFAEEARSVVD